MMYQENNRGIGTTVCVPFLGLLLTFSVIVATSTGLLIVNYTFTTEKLLYLNVTSASKYATSDPVTSNCNGDKLVG